MSRKIRFIAPRVAAATVLTLLLSACVVPPRGPGPGPVPLPPPVPLVPLVPPVPLVPLVPFGPVSHGNPDGVIVDAAPLSAGA